MKRYVSMTMLAILAYGSWACSSSAPHSRVPTTPGVEPDQVVLRVVNESVTEIRPYVHSGLLAVDLGPVYQGDSREFVVPEVLVQRRDVYLSTWSPHKRELHRTSILPLKRGHLYIYKVRATFEMSSVEWYSFTDQPQPAGR